MDGNQPVKKPASRDYCPALAPTVKPTELHCRDIGRALQKNLRYCKEHNCTCLWRVCWACASIGAQPSSASKVIDPTKGLCAFHEENGELSRRLTATGSTTTHDRVRSSSPAVPRGKEEDVPAPAVAAEVESPYDKRYVEALRRIQQRYQATPPLELPIEAVISDPDQPRKYFDPAALKGLADAILLEGQQEPGTVVATDGGLYIIVDGERRWRACQMAGVPTYRAWVCEREENAVLYALSVSKNFNREGHTPIEQANAYKKLLEVGFSQTTIAKMVGKDTSQISISLRLTKLVPEVLALMSPKKGEGLAAVVAGQIGASIAPDAQLKVAQTILRRGFTNPRALQFIRDTARAQGTDRTRQVAPSEEWKNLERRLKNALNLLGLYYDARPGQFKGLLNTRTSAERKKINNTLEMIEKMARELAEAISKS